MTGALKTRMPLVSSLLAVPFFSALLCEAQVNVLTYHNDDARTGLNPNETLLTPTNVNIYGFGKIFSRPVDGIIYAQPLYVSGLSIPGKGTHNVVFVATMHDSVYAFDADSNIGSNAAPIWKTSFINPAANVTVALTTDAVDSPGQDCRTFMGVTGGPGEIGIVGTPVIDATSGTLYVVARTKEPQSATNQTLVQVQRLHALDITTGGERPNSPVVIDAVLPGTGAGSVGGFVHFNPARELQRSALLLANGAVYVTFASYCDLAPYHGWVIPYDAQTLSISANGTNNGIVWQLIPTPASLRAYDANNLSSRLYDSYVNLQAGLPEQVTLVKFNVPTIANGKVFLGTIDSLAVFGLRTYFWSISPEPAAGAIKIVFSGPTGSSVVLQSSVDLVQWADVFTFDSLPADKVTYITSSTEKVQFYRLR